MALAKEDFSLTLHFEEPLHPDEVSDLSDIAGNFKLSEHHALF